MQYSDLLERLTALNLEDLDGHALSIAASEYALETDNPAIGSKRLQVAHEIREWENAKLHDGIDTPVLGALRRSVDVQDDTEGQMKALYRFTSEIDRMVAALPQ